MVFSIRFEALLQPKDSDSWFSSSFFGLLICRLVCRLLNYFACGFLRIYCLLKHSLDCFSNWSWGDLAGITNQAMLDPLDLTDLLDLLEEMVSLGELNHRENNKYDWPRMWYNRNFSVLKTWCCYTSALLIPRPLTLKIDGCECQ